MPLWVFELKHNGNVYTVSYVDDSTEAEPDDEIDISYENEYKCEHVIDDDEDEGLAELHCRVMRCWLRNRTSFLRSSRTERSERTK